MNFSGKLKYFELGGNRGQKGKMRRGKGREGENDLQGCIYKVRRVHFGPTVFMGHEIKEIGMAPLMPR